MIKGAQKQMIVVRTSDSRYFDEAYFVLRREIRPHRKHKTDMLSEADRILRETEFDSPRKKRRLPKGILFFLLGSLCGGGAAVLLFLLL